MNFVNDKMVRVTPEALGNRESDAPAYCVIEKMSARGLDKYAATLKENEIKTNADLFCLIVKKVGNFVLVDTDTGATKELTTPEEVVEIPGIMPLVEEVLGKFAEVNTFSGESKNAPQSSSL